MRFNRDVTYWWTGDPNERYFMEVTRRTDIGTNLFAPLAARGGADTPGYGLVPAVQAGDVVIHYDSAAERITGVSQATGEFSHEPIWWAARGSYARRAGVKPSWLPGIKVELDGYRALSDPVTLADIRTQRDGLMSMRNRLKRQHPAMSLYFPWIPYREGLRTFQTYLAKFPADALALFPSLDSAIRELAFPVHGPGTVSDPASEAEAHVRAFAGKPGRGQGFAVDQRAKVAIEVHAMNLAYEHYSSVGTVEDVSRTASYDYAVNVDGREWHVEVKGTTGDGHQVLLTPNEVRHAQGHPYTALFVVSHIRLHVDDQGNLTAGGGDVRIAQPWHLDPRRLEAVGYKYSMAT